MRKTKKIEKSKAFNLTYFHRKSHFGDDGK